MSLELAVVLAVLCVLPFLAWLLLWWRLNRELSFTTRTRSRPGTRAVINDITREYWAAVRFGEAKA